MATARTGRPRGGYRPGAGRPKGAKGRISRPRIEKRVAAEGMTPRDTLIFVMRWHFKAKRYDDAARTAAMVAPFVHPRLSASNITVKPTLREMFAAATDEELREFNDEIEAELTAAAGLASAKPKGNA